MTISQNPARKAILFLLLAFLILSVFFVASADSVLLAQDGNGTAEDGGPSAIDPDVADAEPADNNEDEAKKKKPEKLGGLRLLRLFMDAGLFFMTPFLIASIAIIALIIERFISLSGRKVIPPGLITGLGQLGNTKGGFDPRRAYRLCQQFPSPASSVIRAMLLKVGRPHSEVEHAVNETSEREADRLYKNVRWLNLAAAVAPLWGLLGTVWGILVAFHETSQLEKGQNMATSLAEGIYTALVTTLCGLLIAIPSAIFAHYFEGRITTLFHQIDELLFNLLPQIERYEGRVRFNRNMGDDDGAPEAVASKQPGEPEAAPAPK